MKLMNAPKTYEQLSEENEHLSRQLEEATDTIHAIRTGQVDALVVQGKEGHQLYTLKTADHTYRVFIETMNEGAVTLNSQGLIVYCNSMFASMVELPLSAVIGLSFSDFVSDKSAQAYNDLFQLGWTEDNKIELLIQGQHRLIPCQLSVNALELDEGVSLSMILTDLTVQKENQRLLEQNIEQLAKTNAALEVSNHDLLQFASVASHDLQEPLRKIQIFAGMLKDTHADTLPPGSLNYLEKIINSSHRMKRMIVDILTYSRLSTNEAGFEPTDLNDIVADVLADFDMVISDKKAVVNVENLPTIDINRGQMRQVFQNLISNALKFTKRDTVPELRISGTIEQARKSGDTTEPPFCTISITDNGIGFDKQYADKVFSLFQRLNTKEAYEGSGIGLAITKRIIDRHKGTISAHSEEGAGSTFIIKLPLVHPV